MAAELQSGLALPNPTAITAWQHFNLNNKSSHYKDDEESDASTKFRRSPIPISIRSKLPMKKKKRRFEESSGFDRASADTPPPQDLRLLHWNKQPKDDDDLPDGGRTCNLTLIRNGGGSERIVGWPPIRTYRKKQLGHGGGIGLFVKAQVEGVLIMRKIDLNLHRSYETLTRAILVMFGRGNESAEGYYLAYQDREGDWLMVVDLPWRTFLEAVRRVKLMRKEE